jgi:hypothetical protein
LLVAVVAVACLSAFTLWLGRTRAEHARVLAATTALATAMVGVYVSPDPGRDADPAPVSSVSDTPTPGAP